MKRLIPTTLVVSVLMLVGCSADDAPTNFPDDTVFTGSTVELGEIEVEDGTEDGLDFGEND